MVTVTNRGPERAARRTACIWFRNTWSCGARRPASRPCHRCGRGRIVADHQIWGGGCCASTDAEWLFTDNETNSAGSSVATTSTPLRQGRDQRLRGRTAPGRGQPRPDGTKAAAHHRLVSAGRRVAYGHRSACARRDADPADGAAWARTLTPSWPRAAAEADEFYAVDHPAGASTPTTPRSCARPWRGCCGASSSTTSTSTGGSRSTTPTRCAPRRGPAQQQWFHMLNGDIISMPDKWEYPWYAAWDLAFHCVALAWSTRRSPGTRSSSCSATSTCTRTARSRPTSGTSATSTRPCMPGPPSSPTTRPTTARQRATPTSSATPSRSCCSTSPGGSTARTRSGRNLFEGGFLGPRQHRGLRPQRPPADRRPARAGRRHGLDGPVQPEHAGAGPRAGQPSTRATRTWPSSSSSTSSRSPGPWTRSGQSDDEMWDEEDGFYYDVLRLPDGTATRLKVRSMVGLIPLCAVSVIPREVARAFPQPDRTGPRATSSATRTCSPTWPTPTSPESTAAPAVGPQRGEAAAGPGPHARRGPLPQPPRRPVALPGPPRRPLRLRGRTARSSEVQYLPAESDTGMFGGNSNWRGPVWFPINLLIVRALLQYYLYYGDDVHHRVPDGLGTPDDPLRGGQGDRRPLISIFLPRRAAAAARSTGHDREVPDRPALAGPDLLFHEYFHGDNGAGHRRQPPDRLDRHGGPPDPAVRLDHGGRDAGTARRPCLAHSRGRRPSGAPS